MIYCLKFQGLNLPLVPELLLYLHLYFGIVCLMIFVLAFLWLVLSLNSKLTCFLLLFVRFYAFLQFFSVITLLLVVIFHFFCSEGW
jgi:hypothetical protein